MPRRANRIGDLDKSLDIMVTGSPNVWVNSRRFCRVGDIDAPSKDMMVTGSPNVWVNSRRATRVGDLDSALEIVITGSPNVFLN